MSNALSKSKYGWKDVCKLWLQVRTPYPLPLTLDALRLGEDAMPYALCVVLVCEW